MFFRFFFVAKTQRMVQDETSQQQQQQQQHQQKKREREDKKASSLDQIEQYFVSKLKKTKIAPTANQLLAYAKENKLSGIASADIYKYLRERVKHTAPHARPEKIRHFQTVGVPRPGMFFIDYAEFKKEWAWHNDGCTGFLVAVENSTNRLFVLPVKGKSTSQWEKSIETFVELTRDVRILLSDRDSVVTSSKFQKEIENKYGIRWHLLRKGNKSYLAERYIGFVKTKLAQSLSYVSEEEGRQVKRWIDFVQPLCESYNNEKIPGTTYRRKTINKTNFYHFLGQQMGLVVGQDLELKFNTFSVRSFVNKVWNKKIFKFQLGDKVRLARKANWKDADEKHKGAFEKTSYRGYFGTNIYTVSSRQLRTTRKRDRLVPVYSLGEMGRYNHFYEQELLKVDDAAAAAAAAN